MTDDVLLRLFCNMAWDDNFQCKESGKELIGNAIDVSGNRLRRSKLVKTQE